MILDQLSQFWDQVEQVWQTAFWGQNVGRGLIALAILAFSFFLRGLIAKVAVAWLHAMMKKTKNEIDDLVVTALERPLELAPIALGVFSASQVLVLTPDMQAAVNKIVQSLIAALIFLALVRLVEPLAHLLGRGRGAMTTTLLDWVRQALKVFLAFTGVAAVLQIWGIPVLPILASFSLLSVAIALGAQDLFKNLIAGATIIFEKRFGPGEWIQVEGVVEGTVEQINFRSTRIRRFDKAPVYVPNAQLSDTAVTNFSRMTYRRIYWTITLEYRTTLDQLKRIRARIEDYVAGNSAFASPFEASTFVRLDKFSNSSIDLMLYCFTKTTVWGEWLEVKEALAYEIKNIVEGEGASFAFPSTSIYVEKGPHMAPPPEVLAPHAPDGEGADLNKAKAD